MYYQDRFYVQSIISLLALNLDNKSIIYNKTYNALFDQNAESLRYKSALTILGAPRATSEEKVYNELGLENLEKKRWYRKVFRFLKNIDTNVQSKYCSYLYQYIKCLTHNKTF